MTPGEYAYSLLEKGYGVQDVSVICRMDRETVRFMRGSVRERNLPPIALAPPPPPPPPMYGPPTPTRGMMIMASIESVARSYGLTKEELIGHNRERRVAWPRQEAMTMLRDRWGLSYPRIGQILGGRDHTTVMAGIRKQRERMEAGR